MYNSRSWSFTKTSEISDDDFDRALEMLKREIRFNRWIEAYEKVRRKHGDHLTQAVCSYAHRYKILVIQRDGRVVLNRESMYDF